MRIFRFTSGPNGLPFHWADKTTGTSKMQQAVRSAVAHGVRQSEEARTSAFTQNVLSVLERVEYRLCEKGEDLEALYRLRYEAYVQAGMVKPDASRMVTDIFDTLPNAYCFGVYYEGRLVSTLRIHHVNAETPLSPSAEVFGDVLMQRLADGESFVDPSRFAADAEASANIRVLPYITLRLAVVACRYFNPTYCLTAIKEEHQGFYRRIFGSVEAVPPRTYPGLTVPVHLYESRCAVNMDRTVRRFPFFDSTASEQRLLFERPTTGELGPLTILPTAKYRLAAA